jgi:hypothetical protein
MMDDNVLVCSSSEGGRRHAILADDGLTGILYLHAPSDNPDKTGEIEATCFAFNRIQPIETKDVHSYRPNPPPIAKGYASKNAVCLEPKSHKWEILWSLDGAAAVLMRDGKPWALVSLAERRGLSKAIQTQGPWGSPWSDEVYKATEWRKGT